jgi:bifunctional UDP-N-acetylglucosamine pyrophosphorylase / glucosamine-1-phosphate N-acetyltransferase
MSRTPGDAGSAQSVAAIVLAAGLGKRMHSDLPKVLHPARGRPLVDHVLDAVYAAGVERVVVVVGHQADRVRAALGARTLEWALQVPQLGTGHAVQQTAPLFAGYEGDVLVLCGDTPLLRAGTLRQLIDTHRRSRAAATVLTATMEDPAGYGRIVRGAGDEVLRIVEERDATPAEKAGREVNSGLYVFRAADLFAALARVGADNAQGEYYLTDTLEILRRAGKRVSAYRCPDAREVAGVNDRQQLQEVEAILAQREGEEDG